MSVHFPDRIKDRMVMRIEDVLLELRVARDMHLPDAIVRMWFR